MSHSYTGKERPRSKSRGRRSDIYLLMDALAQGDEAVQQAQQLLVEARERGKESVQNVITAVEQLFDEVSHVTPTTKDSQEDKRGIDLVITLKDGSKVWVQVKSSSRGMRKFERQQTSGKYDRRIIQLDGQQSLENIQQSFLTAISRFSRQ